MTKLKLPTKKRLRWLAVALSLLVAVAGIGIAGWIQGTSSPVQAQAVMAPPEARGAPVVAGPTSARQSLEWVRLQRSLDETESSLFWGGLPPPGSRVAHNLQTRLYALLDDTLTSLTLAERTGRRPAVDHGAWQRLFADLRQYFNDAPPALFGGPAANREVADALRDGENAIADLPAR